MTFQDSVQYVLKENYANFKGRAPRSEYWWFYLFFVLATFAASILDKMLFNADGDAGLLKALTSLALLAPLLAVSFRRIHDIDKSAWWLLVGFIPIIGFLIYIFWFVQEGTDGPNRFGPDPLKTARNKNPAAPIVTDKTKPKKSAPPKKPKDPADRRGL